MIITLILGSIRPTRESEKPAYYLSNLLQARGHEVRFLDLREMKLPVFDSSAEQLALPEVQRLISSILESDATIAVFPEYNHTYSSAFKNAIDFLLKREFLHQPLGLVAVSNGLVGGARAISLARASLPTLGAIIMPTAVTIPLVQEAFLDHTACANPKIDGMMQAMITEIEAYAPALKTVREQLAQPK